jgi:hypothetical protein
MITSERKATFTRRLNRLKALLRAWTKASTFGGRNTEWIDEKVHDPKMLTNCNCPACRRDKYRNHRQSMKREVANELD